jgi:hypothetical protein
MDDNDVVYDPDIPGVFMIDEDRVMKFSKGYSCPVVLDQVVSNRYRILSLLGWRELAMVWLAVDMAPRSVCSREIC